LQPAAPDHPSGFWQSITVIATTERILAAANAAWYDRLEFERDALNAQVRAGAQTLIMPCVMAEFHSARLLLIKTSDSACCSTSGCQRCTR
jgi:hypothetical protein